MFFLAVDKSIQSAGAAGIWRADAVGIPYVFQSHSYVLFLNRRSRLNWLRYMNMFISTWVLLVAGLVFAFPMIHMRVQEYTDEADDLYVPYHILYSCGQSVVR